MNAPHVRAVVFCTLLMWCSVTTSQVRPMASSGGDSSPIDSLPSGQFDNNNLDLHFRYPPEMQELNPDVVIETGHKKAYGTPPDTDPEHQAVFRCVLPLFDAALPPEKAPQRNANMDGVWVDESDAYKSSRKPEPIFAQIFIAEMRKDCIPKNLPKKGDAILSSLAKAFVSLPGLQLSAKPLWYSLGKQKIHMNSAVGRPTINGQLAPAPIITMSMATEWHRHLLIWVFTSNDTEVFNRTTKSLVKFGDSAWTTMFAPNISPAGSGPPLPILPK